jgi:copper homeostasis protein
MLVEVCANSLQSAINAEKAGADRIELCSELAVGGITPSYGLLKSVKEHISIPVNVLIRPRGGDFSYTEAEFKIMKSNIALCVDLGFDGIVSGALNANFTLDDERTNELIQASKNLKFTFHRAFDWVKHPKATLQELENLGVDTILTSGQQKSAPDGIDLLIELHQQTSECIIMPGGGIRLDTVQLFREHQFKAIHLTGSRFHKTLAESPPVSMNSSSFLNDDAVSISNEDVIREIVQSVK